MLHRDGESKLVLAYIAWSCSKQEIEKKVIEKGSNTRASKNTKVPKDGVYERP